MTYADDTIISLIIRIIEGFAQVYLLTSILQKKVREREYIISVLTIVALYEIVSNILPLNYNYKFITTVLIIIPVVTIVCKINLYKVILGYMITTVIIVVLDMFGGLILLHLLDVAKFQDISNHPTYYYIGMMLLNLLIFITGATIKYFKMTYAKAENNIKNIGIAFNTLLTLLFIFPSIIIIISYVEKRPLAIESIMVSLISMLAIVVLSIYNSQKRYNLIVSEKNLEYEKNNNAILRSLVDSLRTFKHDYSNTLATLYGYVQLEDMTSLKRMFKEILEESRQISSLDKINPNLIKDPNIFGLVVSKYQECVKKNITMDLEIFTELEDLEIKMYDLTRILGILLDNAIEAAGGSKGRKISIIIEEIKEKIEIKISNTYSDKLLSVEKIFEKGVSSKGKNRGLGLYKVKEIVNKYPNVELKTVIDKELFMQKLTILKNYEGKLIR